MKKNDVHITWHSGAMKVAPGFCMLALFALVVCKDLGIIPEPPLAVIPEITVEDITVSEGGTESFRVSLSEATTVEVSFDASFVNGLATGGSDFTTSAGTYTVSAGIRSVDIEVTAVDDGLTEPNETFSLILSNATHALFADSVAIGTIVGTSEPILRIFDLTIAEGQSASLQVTTSIISSLNITFDWTTQSASAQAGSDYVGATGTATIIAGTSTTSVPIQINTDAVSEGEETFQVVISNPTNAAIGDGTAVVTIPANTAPVSFAASVRPLIATNCAVPGCHGSGSSDGGLALGSATYSQVRNAVGFSGAIITNPPNGANSILYRVLTSSPPSGIDRMPDGGPYFNNTQLQIIKDWIDQGALDN